MCCNLGLPIPTCLRQLCRQFRAGNLERTEVDVNISEGFVQRRFEPLAPAAAAGS